MRGLRLVSLFLLANQALAVALNRVIRLSTDPPRKQTPLTSATIEALPAYDTVKVATVHYEYTGSSGEVPQVQGELAGMQFIFQQYGFQVIDLAIPQSSSLDAQNFMEAQVKNLYSGLSSPGSLVIIIYGGHGNPGELWSITRGDESIFVNWSSIDANIIANTGVDTLQIIDTCFAGSFLASSADISPDTFNGRAAFSVIASASASKIALTNELAFTKAVIHTLAPADGAVPVSFTPQSLFNALPVVNQAYAQISGDYGEVDAIISGSYTPQFYQLGTTFASLDTPANQRKIAALNC